jgi:hypothetical protein
VKLADAWIHGLRRFGGDTPHRVRIDAKLVCLIGANEAGKSTVIDSMEIAQGDAAVVGPDRTRRETVPDDREILRLRYRLDQADRDALGHIPCDKGAPAPHWFEVIRRANGTPRFVVDPPLVRDRASREPMLDRLRAGAERWWPERKEDDEGEEPSGPDRERVERLIEALASVEDNLGEAVVSDLRLLADEIEEGDDTLAEDLRGIAEHESARHPNQLAADVLWERTPDFVRFDEEARGLESEYDLETAADDPGAALDNLAALAGLNLVELRDAINRSETGTVRDLREAANRVLAERFEAWQQEPRIQVVLENEGKLLRIHVQSGTGPTMPFHERSDGLRQFVALVALTAQEQRTAPPILLIDELETHLHYDAQSDLVEVLARQNAAAQVIYTTHSAACLPEDLGLGVRVIEGIGELTASTVRQNFWRDEHPGMGALLMAMGAASLAFVPLRPAVIAEGGSDLVLLPSLIREAIERDHLELAVVPGSSSTPPDRIAGLDLQGVRTAWIFDADEGGRARRVELTEAYIPAERMFLLAEDGDLEIEDLVEPQAYCEAVRLYVADAGGTDDVFTPDDLPPEPCQRHDTVIKWCEARGLHPPGKIAIANKVIELVGNMTLLDPAHADRLRNLHERFCSLLSS